MGPNPGAIFLVIGTVLAIAGIGFTVEAIICKKLFSARLIFPIATLLLYIICGFVFENSDTDVAAIFRTMFMASSVAFAFFGRKKEE